MPLEDENIAFQFLILFLDMPPPQIHLDNSSRLDGDDRTGIISTSARPTVRCFGRGTNVSRTAADASADGKASGLLAARLSPESIFALGNGSVS